ncbi:fibronectin type III domain-containing protein [Sphingobacterium chuzhouense]|uniref:Fibronectin type III domain-containing protein n=1 Tax=Sphingobacterium chuzhouense TaxID=1742264 RepID=A0ABR7XX20_9SPHI|nr:fibronectin type III domain-containing protein [Sphingobacterium chuzhouense]MBD1423595.1 fibronectin type III domain-containing protein [Sphingobacterium chuzhouense]
MSKPTTQSQRLKDDNLMQYVEQIITNMRAATATYPEPVPGLDTMEAALTDFRLSATEAAYRDRRAIRIRQDKRKRLEYLLTELAKYVDTIANKDVNLILASGFALPKDVQSYDGPAPKATNLVAEPQQVGSRRIKLKIDRWKGARMYRFEARKKGETEWQTQFSTRSTCTLEGLEMFEEYEFRATYMGINSEPNYSNVVSSYVV